MLRDFLSGFHSSICDTDLQPHRQPSYPGRKSGCDWDCSWREGRHFGSDGNVGARYEQAQMCSWGLVLV